jgi:hypothetical protein
LPAGAEEGRVAGNGGPFPGGKGHKYLSSSEEEEKCKRQDTGLRPL